MTVSANDVIVVSKFAIAMDHIKNNRIARSMIDSKVLTLAEPFMTNLDCINAIKSTLEEGI